MKCIMLKLFQSLLGTTLCGGQTCTLGGLNTSARVYLSQHNCLRKDTDYTNAELIMNRLIPDRIEIDKISDVDICDNHKRNLTVLHKSTRQKHCAFSECKKPGRINKPRVDFELSALLYERTGLHIPVGSVLCYEHRNLVTSGALAEQQILRFFLRLWCSFIFSVVRFLWLNLLCFSIIKIRVTLTIDK